MIETSSQVEVLIVGAGPSGLALAAILAKAGIRIRLIDKNPARSDKSKAIGVQAGTLEAIEALFGEEVALQMVSCGVPVGDARIHLGAVEPIHLALSEIPSKYNYVLILKQSETERFLEEQLSPHSVKIERQQEFISLKETAGGVICEIRNGNGIVEKVFANIVVGCDGSNSAVRRELDIPFTGGTYSGDFALGDVKIEWQLEYGVIQVFMTDKGIMACFPMPGERRYRVIIIPKASDETAQSSQISIQELQDLASALVPGGIQLSEPVWLTRFRVHHRIARRFRKGRGFLVGDAAHIHSPVGGQGMNTGIQDAFNLGDKLVRVFRKQAPATLLDRYEVERYPIAKRVLESTHFVFELGLMNENFFKKIVRDHVLPFLTGFTWIQRLLVTAVSQVGIARKDIARRS